MEEKKSNGHLSDSLRRKLENFPEEFPSENEWQQIRSRMLSEGLLRKKSNRKRYLLWLLLLLMVSISGLLTVPTWIKKQPSVVKTDAPQTQIQTEEKISKEKIDEEANKNVDENISTQTENQNIKPVHEENSKQGGKPAKAAKAERPQHASAESNPNQQNSAGLSQGSGTKRTSVFSSSAETASEAGKNNESGTPVESSTPPENTAPAGINTETTKEATEDKRVPSASETIQPVTEASKTTAAPEAAPADSASVVQQPDATKADSTLANAASENKSKPDNTSVRKFQLGLFVSWDRNNYYLKESSNAERAAAEYIQDSELMDGKKSAEQFTIGLRGSYFISSKTAIEAGAFYSQKRKVDAAIYTPQYSSSSGESISDFVYHLNAKYFEAEERIKYFVYQKKPSVYVAAGVKESFILSQDSPDYFEHTLYSTSAVPRTERVLLKPASMGLSLVLAAGAEIAISPRSNFFLEPSYSYALDPVINNPSSVTVPVNLFRRSFSIGTGLNYKF